VWRATRAHHGPGAHGSLLVTQVEERIHQRLTVGEREHWVLSAVRDQCGDPRKIAESVISRPTVSRQEVIGHARGHVIRAIEHPLSEVSKSRLIKGARPSTRTLTLDHVVDHRASITPFRLRFAARKRAQNCGRRSRQICNFSVYRRGRDQREGRDPIMMLDTQAPGRSFVERPASRWSYRTTWWLRAAICSHSSSSHQSMDHVATYMNQSASRVIHASPSTPRSATSCAQPLHTRSLTVCEKPPWSATAMITAVVDACAA